MLGRSLFTAALFLGMTWIVVPSANAYDEGDRCGARLLVYPYCDGPDPDVAGGLSQVTPTWPTLSKGSRGVNVKALQWLLSARYHLTVDKDGKFDAATKSSVQSAQGLAGLTADGVVGQNTWEALTVTITPGDSGPDVRALRVLLQAKWYEDVDLADNDFTSTLGTRVNNFKTHVDLSDNTKVGDDAWKYLLWHFVKARPSDAAGLCDGGWDQPWGTAYTVDLLIRASNAVHDRYGGVHKVAMNDISRAHGGTTLFHSSHQVGKDIDVRLMTSDGYQCGETHAFDYDYSTYSEAKTTGMIQEFIEASINFNTSRRIQGFLFNDTDVQDNIDILYPNDTGLVTSATGHSNHVHVDVK